MANKDVEAALQECMKKYLETLKKNRVSVSGIPGSLASFLYGEYRGPFTNAMTDASAWPGKKRWVLSQVAKMARFAAKMARHRGRTEVTMAEVQEASTWIKEQNECQVSLSKSGKVSMNLLGKWCIG